MIKPPKFRKCTFNQYAEDIFLPYVQMQLTKVQRLDIVWDIYIPNSLKAGTRRKRGIGVRRRVSSETIVPSNWDEFLRTDDNKTELFEFLATHCGTMSVPEGKCVISTKGTEVVATTAINNVPSLAPCSHEEADTRLLLHTAHVAQSGFTKATIKTVDIDVLVLAISVFQKIGLEELWVEFGSGNTLRHIPVHSLIAHIGEDVAKALPVFHAFTGCDQVSKFASIGKRTAWKILRQCRCFKL